MSENQLDDGVVGRGNKDGAGLFRQWFQLHYQAWLSEDEANSDFALDLHFPDSKPPAFIALDDRALTFNGVWPELETLTNFKPWNKS